MQATTYISLEDSVLSEVGQKQKGGCCVVCIRSQNGQIQRDRKLKGSCQGSCGRDSRQFVFSSYNSSNKHETMSPYLMLLILKNVEVANAVYILHTLKNSIIAYDKLAEDKS